MTRTLPFVGLFALLSCAAHAQGFEIGLSSGATNYNGDLGNYDGAVQWNATRPGVAITLRDFLPNPKRYVTRVLNVETRFSWNRLGYNEAAPIGDKQGTDLRNYRRGLNFRNDLFGVSTHLVMNMYREPYQPLFKQRFFAYCYVGVGLFYGRPKGDLFHGSESADNKYYYWDDGTVRDKPRGSQNANVIGQDGTYETDLYSWATEGDSRLGEGSIQSRPSPWHVGFPVGFGLRYMVTKQISIGTEFSYYMFITDMLDAVSDRYATYSEIGQAYPDSTKQFLARYVSDPTGYGTDGTTGFRTSRRGNPGLPDSFSYFTFEVSYKFKHKAVRRSFVSL